MSLYADMFLVGTYEHYLWSFDEVLYRIIPVVAGYVFKVLM